MCRGKCLEASSINYLCSSAKQFANAKPDLKV